MKLQADRATLMKALAHVQSVVERRNTIPILANVMIAVREGKLSLTATDMEIAIVEDVAASTTRNGACTAPAATLVRNRPPAAGRRGGGAGSSGRRRAVGAAGRPLRDQSGGAAGRGLPGHDRRHAAAPVQPVGANAARSDRPHAVRHQHGGNPVLPERYLPARRRQRGHQGAAGGRHRRASPRPGGGAVAGGCRRRCPASSSRARPSTSCANCWTR